MIKGIGVDVVKTERIKLSNTSFLSKKEYEIFLSKSTSKQKLNFLAGRWVAKEAIFKAWANAPKIFSKITILNDKYGNPYVEKFNNIKISISHEDVVAIAFCIIE